MFVALLIQWNPRFSSRDLLQNRVQLLSIYLEWSHMTKAVRKFSENSSVLESLWYEWVRLKKGRGHLMALSPCFISPVSSSQETSNILRNHYCVLIIISPLQSRLFLYAQDIFGGTPGVQLICLWVNEEERSPKNKNENTNNENNKEKRSPVNNISGF